MQGHTLQGTGRGEISMMYSENSSSGAELRLQEIMVGKCGRKAIPSVENTQNI